MIAFDLPGMRLVSLLNDRSHWAARAARAKKQRWAAMVATRAHLLEQMRLPLVVTITRRGPGTLDSDNLAACAKHVRDGIADALGIDDGDERITWVVRQERARLWGVSVEIRRRGESEEAAE